MQSWNKQDNYSDLKLMLSVNNTFFNITKFYMLYTTFSPLSVAEFAFSQSSYDIVESDGPTDVVVVLVRGSLTFDIRVRVTSFAVTATGNLIVAKVLLIQCMLLILSLSLSLSLSDPPAGVDYNDISAFLTFFAGATPGSTQSTVLTIIDDFVEEINETVELLASIDSDSQAVLSPGRSLVTLNILDNDGTLHLRESPSMYKAIYTSILPVLCVVTIKPHSSSYSLVPRLHFVASFFLLHTSIKRM